MHLHDPTKPMLNPLNPGFQLRLERFLLRLAGFPLVLALRIAARAVALKVA